MRVLVAHGSMRGGTEGLAQLVGEALREAGHQVDVRRAREVRDVRPWDAVIVGGGLYAFRWVWEARRFVTLNADELRTRPVWFFSSGALDAENASKDLPPTRQVQRLMAEVGARGHVTFGGRLSKDAKGFIARALVRRGMVGDFRDPVRVRAWAAEVARALETAPVPVPTPTSPVLKRWLTRLTVTLCLFAGVTALAGGVELMTYSTGAAWLPPLSVLAHTPFATFVVPGVLLFTFVGFPNLAAAIALLVRRRWSGLLAFAAGAALAVWIVSEMVLLRAPSGVEVFYLALGLVTAAVAGWLTRVRARPAVTASS
jgi:menaquinone-dependent protoporphyrinogen oxidase